MDDRLEILIRSWARLGAGFNVPPADRTPDLERLLLDTCRHAPQMSRLFIMAATWLRRYGHLAAKGRFKRLIREELEPQFQPTLGFLLEMAQQDSHTATSATLTRDLPAADPPHPLFDIDRTTPALFARAHRRASDLSKRWGLWCEPLEFKDDALFPPAWVMPRNPSLIPRADFRGDLRASILASLQFDPGAGASELALARACGGSRAQVRAALTNLELSGKVQRIRTPQSRGTLIKRVA